MTPIQKLAKLALENPELRDDLFGIFRDAGMWQDISGPPTTAIYENQIDHGYDQALGGGHDIMKRLQDQFLIEQGREPRDKNPRLAAAYNYDEDSSGPDEIVESDTMDSENVELMFTRNASPQVVASIELQMSLIALMGGPYGRSLVKTAVMRYAAATDTTVVVNAAVDDIINNALAVALDPQRMGQVIARHTAKEQ